MSDQPAAPPPTLDAKHDAELIKARQTLLEAQARARTALDEAAVAEEAYSALLALKINDPENGWRPRIWALEKSDSEKEKRLEELEALPGAKK